MATLVPHVHPDLAPGFPPYAIGARLPRTAVGRALAGGATDRLVARGLEQGRREYNECRARLGLGPLPWVHTGISRSLTLVATLPQLEYPRAWPAWLRVVGPLMWEPPGERVGAAAGLGPGRAGGAVDRAGSRAPAAAGGAGRPGGRAGAGDRDLQRPRAVAAGRRCRRTRCSCRGCPTRRRCPPCDLVVAHGGHGTLMRALALRLPGRALARRRRHGRERGAGRLGRARRAAAAAAAARRAACALAVRRALARPTCAPRVRRVADWIAAHDGRLAGGRRDRDAGLASPGTP